MARAPKVKGLAPKKPFNVNSWKGELHYHGCTQCRIRYTCACKTPEVDERCEPCNTGQGHAFQRGLLPILCCFEECIPATKDDRQLYKLAGQGPWWICRRCARQFTAYPGSSS